MGLFLAYFNEACILISAALFGIGWYQIRQGRQLLHKRLMLTGSTFAALFFITYVLKTIFIGDTAFGGPKSMANFYYAFLQTHSILATVAAIFGIVTLVFAFRMNFAKHRKVGPWTVVIWFITAATGLTVFILLYIAYPIGPTTNLFKAWMG
ncbi:DUF420 domain-containing protein [Alicyclobacillus tolerans]|uniref:Membrane protein n=2 Tax=Alicyclobacillus tolerans TaxID=90970 RepID=A0ABT9LXY4_9BACL|nr:MULTISPECIES: DUF420 domain-containing protein [Alicyclobacillus]MDP9729120.1 putative membrane protein [Alicyclobacillus tengchongensis]SHK00721.1 putative membrane protein [Alicyclobacillus montanus]